MPSPEEVRHLLLKEKIIEDASWELDSPLISSGEIDSLDLVRLIALLEETYNVSIPDDALMQSNFETCNSITETVSAALSA